MKDRAKIEAAAEKLIKRGKIQDAVLEYRKLLSGEEQDIPILTTIGDLLVKSEQTDKAVSEFRKIAEFYEKKGLYSKSIAILKRINRLSPDDIDNNRKLADLLHDQGFASEAKTGYLKLAKAYVRLKRSKDAVAIYEKLIKLSPEDFSSRTTLAELYQGLGETEKAVGELNMAAEYLIRQKKLTEARKALDKARELHPDNPKTLTNLIELLRNENKKQEALGLIGEILKKDKENLKALYLLGNLHFDEGQFKEAVDVYKKILSIRPKEVEARVKLGRIHLRNKEVDPAYELFAPLADTLMRKQKAEKAIGLMGLILEQGAAHLPALEKLGEIYREKEQKENFSTLGRVVLAEYEKQGLKEKRLRLLGELVDFFPENEEYYYDYRRLKEALGVVDDELGVEQVAIKVDEAKQIIDSTLAKADLYLEQGLIRNAKRILENLRIRFPDEPKIKARFDQIKRIPVKGRMGDLAQRVGNVAKKESQILGKIPDTTQQIATPDFHDSQPDEKLTAADIFAETDIIPLASAEGDNKNFFDLSGRISEEQEAIKAMYNYQIRGDTTIVEKALTDIVTDFRKALEDKVDKDDHEAHYNLGIAFLEQGLYDEAIAECKLAASGKKQAVDSYNLISLCYRHKEDFPEALKWLNEAVKLAEKDSEQYFALQYEIGALYEQMEDPQNAVKYFKGVHKWNSGYRDVELKLKALKK